MTISGARILRALVAGGLLRHYRGSYTLTVTGRYVVAEVERYRRIAAKAPMRSEIRRRG